MIIETSFSGWPSIWYGGERWEGGAKKWGCGEAGVHGETFSEQETFHSCQLQTTLVRFDEALSRLLRRRWRGECSIFFFFFLQFLARHILSTPCFYFSFHSISNLPLPDCSLIICKKKVGSISGWKEKGFFL